MSDVRPPSGTQWTLSAHDQELVVVESGGGIRSYRVGGEDVLFGYDEAAKCDAGRGQHLIPWPNRIRDGVYTFADKKQQLPLTEPARNNASHGLTRWANWHLVEQSGDRLVVGYQLLPQPGWDGILDLTITYELTGEGLVVTPAATNAGSAAVPFGYGAHPYLTAGEESVDELRLETALGERLHEHAPHALGVTRVGAAGVEAGADRVVERLDDVVAVRLLRRDDQACGRPRLFEEGPVIIGQVAALVEDGEAHDAPGDAHVTRLLDLHEPAGRHPRPRAHRVEEHLDDRGCGLGLIFAHRPILPPRALVQGWAAPPERLWRTPLRAPPFLNPAGRTPLT